MTTTLQMLRDKLRNTHDVSIYGDELSVFLPNRSVNVRDIKPLVSRIIGPGYTKIISMETVSLLSRYSYVVIKVNGDYNEKA